MPKGKTVVTVADGVVFIGGRELGARCLQVLIDEGVHIACILARTDEALLGTQRAVAAVAAQRGIACIAPTDPRAPDVVEWVRSHRPGLGFCVMYPRMLPSDLLEVPARGVFNLHGAPLPGYRGVLGHAWAIINGDDTYGVTLHRMDEALDSGPIVAQQSFAIAVDETGTSLHAKAVSAAFELFSEVAPRLVAADLPEVEQDESAARYYSRRPPFDRSIDWTWSPADIARYLRAMEFPGIPMPSADGVQVLRARPISDTDLTGDKPGTVVRLTEQGAVVCAGGGWLLVEAVKPPGDAHPLIGSGISSYWSPGKRLAR